MRQPALAYLLAPDPDAAKDIARVSKLNDQDHAHNQASCLAEAKPRAKSRFNDLLNPPPVRDDLYPRPIAVWHLLIDEPTLHLLEPRPNADNKARRVNVLSC